MKYIKKVEGENVYLSLSIKEDLELYTKWLNDPKLNLSFGKSHDAWTLQRQEAYINDYNDSDDKFFFVIVSKKTKEAIGIGILYDISYVHGKSTMGILIDEKYQSKGYGKEASKLLLEFAFNILNLNNMMLYAIEFNEKAIEMYKSIGFKVIGKRRKAYPINNQTYDEIYLDILKEEYNALK
ncbi:GNAT family N-acetyltransferase [Methanobrevibacter olleyae]|uniref:GNAT family acetyltransferase n=1 Tax=Methanobrevibacter olleyae TaxID=294671 RepID=A0A126QY40_METOL|nr:GNAT family protein [Methanobrevibacter olleyae]AMK14727.1 GNAT family acetyltransferase [Methanobrevibacter olleyae]